MGDKASPMKQPLDFARWAKMIIGMESGKAATARRPIIIARPPGVCPDDMDMLGMSEGERVDSLDVYV